MRSNRWLQQVHGHVRKDLPLCCLLHTLHTLAKSGSLPEENLQAFPNIWDDVCCGSDCCVTSSWSCHAGFLGFLAGLFARTGDKTHPCCLVLLHWRVPSRLCSCQCPSPSLVSRFRSTHRPEQLYFGGWASTCLRYMPWSLVIRVPFVYSVKYKLPHLLVKSLFPFSPSSIHVAMLNASCRFQAVIFPSKPLGASSRSASLTEISSLQVFAKLPHGAYEYIKHITRLPILVTCFFTYLSLVLP